MLPGGCPRCGVTTPARRVAAFHRVVRHRRLLRLRRTNGPSSGRPTNPNAVESMIDKRRIGGQPESIDSETLRMYRAAAFGTAQSLTFGNLPVTARSATKS